MIFTALIVLLSLLLFYVVLSLPLSGLIKFIIIAIAMYAVGLFLAKKHKLSTEMGFILLKSKRGLDLINELAKKQALWNFFADVGLVMSYGALSAFIFKKHFNWKAFAAGMIAIALLSFLVAPNALHFLSSILGSGLGKKIDAGAGGNLISIIMLLFFFIGGFFLALLSGIVYYSVVLLSLLAQFIFSGSSAIAAAQPGGTLLLPGINLPFLEGVLALVVVLVVHEGSHAILSRIASIPLLSSGIVLFGIIPIGAFVEPDEKKLSRSPQQKQTRILVAGSTANFFTSLLFFAVFVPFALFFKSQPAESVYYGLAHFLYTFLGLVFSLNFVVATVNILPLPLFDGYRLLEINIKNKAVVSALMYITLIAFALNFLPWFFAH